MGDRLATIDMGRKVGVAAVLLFWGELGPHQTQRDHGPRPTSLPSDILIHPAVWPQQTWADNWGLCPFWGSWVPI